MDVNAFHELSNLVELGLERNLLENIPERTFVRLPELGQLNLNGNQLQTIGDHWYTEDNKLKVLDVSKNQITAWRSSSFKNLRSLEHLNFSSNAIVDMPERVFEALIVTQVQYFCVNYECNEIPDSWLGKGNHLKILDLSHNHIRELQQSSFENLQNLTDLDLFGNRIKQITAQTEIG